MAQENIEIDVRAWLVRILNNWYWFVLSAAIFGLLGVLSFFSTTYKFEVGSEIMLRGAENGNTFLQPDMLDMLGIGGEKKVDDEIVALASRDIISRVISDLNVQAEYRKKDGLRWVGQYPKCNIMLASSSAFLDSLRQTVEITIKVRKNDYVVRVKHGRKCNRYTTNDLTQPIKTKVGVLCFDLPNPNKVIKGEQYKITAYPLPVLVSIYKGRISVTTGKKDSKVITISSTTDIPQREKEFIQRMIELYNTDAMADKNLVAQTTAQFIDQRLQVLENELMQAEENTVRYLEAHDYVKPHIEIELFLSEDIEYRRQLTEVETQINIMNYLCEFMEENANAEDLLPAIFMLPTYQLQGEDQAKPSHTSASELSLITAVEDYNELIIKKMHLDTATAKVQAEKIDAELSILRTNILNTIKSVLNTMLITKKDLENHFALSSEKRSGMPDYVKEYERMARRKMMQEKIYMYISEQREANALLLSSTIMPIKVIAQSQINPIPVSPHYMTIFFFLIIGLVLPLGVMVLFDIVNNRVSDNQKKLKKRLHIPLIGTLAKVSRNQQITILDNEHSVSSELFRTLRTNVRFMQPANAQCHVILVTSGVRNEGKSHVSTNLAISLSLLGKKVALVELDVRQPVLATYFNLPSQGCLTHYLADTAYTLQQATIASSISNLDIIPAGAVPPNPSELLQRERLDELFVALRQSYDYVIVDTAPLTLVSDTFLLRRVADMTLCVLRANHTTYDVVDSLNIAYEQQRLPNMVAVLNAVDTKKITYGYGVK